jgi:dipeptidyl-peptidase-4
MLYSLHGLNVSPREDGMSWLRYLRGPLAAALCAGAMLDTTAQAQQRLFTIDDLYDPVKRVDIGPPESARRPYTWLNDRECLRIKDDRTSHVETRFTRVDTLTGAEIPLFDDAKLDAALARLPGVTADEARRSARLRSFVLNDDKTALLVTLADDLYYWPFGAERIVRLTSSAGVEQEVSFSPDGRLVAFVRDRNLFTVDLEGHERALTTDGGSQLLNGQLDWLYEEEIYGRGTHRAYWWSPDASRLAFLQLNEAPVPEFAVIDHIPYRQIVELTDYPKAGDPNPTVRLGVVRAAGGPVQWVDTTRYGAAEHLIVNVDWAPDSKDVVYQVQDREQTWLDLNLGTATSGSSTTLFRETTQAWVNENGAPTWLKDGTFLWFSERDGWKHLYRYRRDGTLVGRVTSGPWEVRTLYGVDEPSGVVYFGGTERSPIAGDVYRIRLDGTGLTRLSQADGSHSASFNPSRTYYVDTWSDVSTPTQARLHKADGSQVRVIDGNVVTALKEYRLSTPEFVRVTAKDGFTFEAMLIKPTDFDPSRKYPVFQHTYGGPHAQQVRNAWGGVNGLYYELLAQRGIVVWVCDNRSASGKGAVSSWAAYKRLGESELADIEECLGWLKQQPWVDTSRIGLDGWSYGGFMTSYALTHSTSFSMGIAGGTVSDWRDYDSVYTERYMLMPQNNPEGYARTAPRFAAKNLHGSLFLIHGTMDDNVHMQNTLQFVYELEKAGKPFELMLYPRSRHGVTDPLLVKHLRERMLEFTLLTLKPDGGAAGTK